MFSEAVRHTETFIPPPCMRPIVSISRDMDTVKSTLRAGEIPQSGVKLLRSEIRLDGGWVDLGEKPKP